MIKYIPKESVMEKIIILSIDLHNRSFEDDVQPTLIIDANMKSFEGVDSIKFITWISNNDKIVATKQKIIHEKDIGILKAALAAAIKYELCEYAGLFNCESIKRYQTLLRDQIYDI